MYELIEGAHTGGNIERKVEQTMGFLNLYETVPFDEDAAMICGRIGAQLRAKGKTVGSNDIMIAATVMSRNGILVTNNTKEFSRIEGLRLEDWTRL